MDMQRIEDIIAGFSSKKILVIGDIMLDEYIWGRVERISPEAPVPVVEVIKRTAVPGGATNVVNNLASLGCQPVIAGVTGEDSAGLEITRLLSERHIDVQGIIRDDMRPTTVKSRIIAHNQQIARTDIERRDHISDDTASSIMDFANRISGHIDGVIISDYGKGMVSPVLMLKLLPLLRQKGLFVAVDPKTPNMDLYSGASLISPNNKEAGEAMGVQVTDMKSLVNVGSGLLDRLDIDSVLITRGEEGMSLFTRHMELDKSGELPANVEKMCHDNVQVLHIPTVARKVYDVTGAGDTVIAAFTLAVAAGASQHEAAWLANHAAGIVVGQVGTATASIEELRRSTADESRRKSKGDIR